MANKRVKTNTEILANGKLEGLTYKSENVLDLIKNKALQSDLKAYLKAETDSEKSAWKMVRLLGKMSGEIKQDFGSDYAFADFMGMSQTVVNKRKRLAEFAIELEKLGYTDTKAFELLPLINKMKNIDSHERKLEIFRQVLEMLSPDMTQKELREAVKHIDIEIDDNQQVMIEQKASESNENEEAGETGESDEKEEAGETGESVVTIGTEFDLEDMIEIDLPVWLDSELQAYTITTYSVSGEVLKELLNAIEDVIGKDVK